MPLPERDKGERRAGFIAKCMADPKMNAEYPNRSQRYAICVKQSLQ